LRQPQALGSAEPKSQIRPIGRRLFSAAEFRPISIWPFRVSAGLVSSSLRARIGRAPYAGGFS